MKKAGHKPTALLSIPEKKLQYQAQSSQLPYVSPAAQSKGSSSSLGYRSNMKEKQRVTPQWIKDSRDKTWQDTCGFSPTALQTAQGTRQCPGVFLRPRELSLHQHQVGGSQGLHRAGAQSSPPAVTGSWSSPQGSPSLPWHLVDAARRQKDSLVWGHSLHQSPLYLKSSTRAQLGWEEDLKDPRELHSHFSPAELA